VDDGGPETVSGQRESFSIPRYIPILEGKNPQVINWK